MWGNISEFFHFINDIWIFLGWIFTNLAGIFSVFFAPVKFIFTFLYKFSSMMFKPAIMPEFAEHLPDSELLQTIPGWSYISLGIATGFLVIFGIFIIKQFQKV